MDIKTFLLQKIKYIYSNSIEIFNFYFNPGTSQAHENMGNNTFEPEETKIIKSLLKSCDVFVDVGANIGYYSKIAIDEHKYVISIEPQPGNLKKLYNAGCDEVFPVALADKPGILTLYGSSSVSASLIKKWANAPSFINQTIPVSTLDIIIGNRFNGKGLLIKVDVEGCEYQVLQGALNTLKLNPKPIWILEICGKQFHPNGFNPYFDKTFEIMNKNGYVSRKIDEINYLFVPIDEYNDYCR